MRNSKTCVWFKYGQCKRQFGGDPCPNRTEYGFRCKHSDISHKENKSAKQRGNPKAFYRGREVKIIEEEMSDGLKFYVVRIGDNHLTVQAKYIEGEE